jgi:hypothetical protein
MRRFVVSLLSSLLLASVAFAGPDDSSSSTVVQPTNPKSTSQVPADEGKVAFGVKTSLLGVGAEVAARATHRSNVRVGFNVLGYSRSFNKDGIDYNGHLNFRTMEAHYDIFPWARSFHISPGLLTYFGNPITASALVPGNQSFSLGGVDYTSDPNQPASASGKVKFNRVAPMITVGFGNLVHRDSKRFTVPFEVGVAFQGSPTSTLSVTGNVCAEPGLNCRNAATDQTVQSNVISEQSKINNSMRWFKVYPIISVGFGYKF